MTKDVYVLGTGLSHNGSSVLLKNGRVLVGIEKERLSRLKHDGGNDTLSVEYCLQTAGITLDQVDLVVQCENFVIPSKNQFKGKRVFESYSEDRFYAISHHLAHAYSAVGTCPFESFYVMVIDGCGSPHDQCLDRDFSLTELNLDTEHGLICEKDSFYFYNGRQLQTLFKDFSPLNTQKSPWLPTTNHSIGGFYAAVSHYCFRNLNDIGKLMGLAPLGKPEIQHEAFRFDNGRVFLKDDWDNPLKSPATDWQDFKLRKDHFANIAHWAQEQIEKAVEYIFDSRLKGRPSLPLAYSGGVALNAVANGKLLQKHMIDEFYIEPAAADNGLALGCAFYGWLEILKKERQPHDGDTCFGKSYQFPNLEDQIDGLQNCTVEYLDEETLLRKTAGYIAQNKTVGWFQGACEFGPRALGRRSILANPSNEGMKDHINRNIKFREDFRPFAPALLVEELPALFQDQFQSPYMILVDRPLESAKEKLRSVIHVNGTARTQTVDPHWNPKFHRLIQAIKAETGLGVVLNTSFNKKGQPMVETPKEAIELFINSALDVLVIENHLICK